MIFIEHKQPHTNARQPHIGQTDNHIQGDREGRPYTIISLRN